MGNCGSNSEAEVQKTERREKLKLPVAATDAECAAAEEVPPAGPPPEPLETLPAVRGPRRRLDREFRRAR
jgi:hypothetical protein